MTTDSVSCCAPGAAGVSVGVAGTMGVATAGANVVVPVSIGGA